MGAAGVTGRRGEWPLQCWEARERAATSRRGRKTGASTTSWGIDSLLIQANG